MSKKRIRQEIAAKRKVLDSQWLEATSIRVVENFQTLDAFKTSETVALYMAIGGEVTLQRLFPICWTLGKQTCIPVFNAETKLYEMAGITADTPYRTGRYGIREPSSPTLVAMGEIDLIAVPGVAFDLHGNRLGRGGGYYDRLLEGFCGQTIGIAFDFQLLPKIPATGYDKPMQCIVTETKILNF